MEEFKNLKEIIELCKEELDKNDENVNVTLDFEDLKELRDLLDNNKLLKIEIEKLNFINKRQRGNLYTFYKDEKQETLLKKYCWCQKPTNTTMSLNRFVSNGEIEGFMSESLAERRENKWIDLNEFIFNFVKPIVKKKIELSNKCEEQEKIIELMAEFYAKGNTIRGTKEQIIECFREKAKGE